MKEYLLSFFEFNDATNRRILARILELPDPREAVRLFSHMINSQLKWYARITHDPRAIEMDWFNPLYPMAELQTQWEKSLILWVGFLNELEDEDLLKEVRFSGPDNGTWYAQVKDIPLQLNYHAIHHRAQIQMIIRNQGLQPDFIDYIGTVYRKVE